MRLDQLLVYKGCCSTRQEAQEAIARGAVFVNGVLITKQSKDFTENADVYLAWSRKYVSRGGDKLAGIFSTLFGSENNIEKFLQDKRALDIGSSTGGFTDFLLQHKINTVTCVDVGTDQLHPKIRQNNKVSVYENTDIRDFNNQKTYDIVVADLSFIPLKLVISTLLSFGKETSLFLLLIKPQFEVGKGNTKKGVVKNMLLVGDLLDEYRQIITCSQGKNIRIEPCVIQGGDGNQEYFITFNL